MSKMNFESFLCISVIRCGLEIFEINSSALLPSGFRFCGILLGFGGRGHTDGLEMQVGSLRAGILRCSLLQSRHRDEAL